MILVELTINGTVHRISNDWINTLTHMWDGLVKSFQPVQYATRSQAGGYVEPQYGTLILSPEVFEADADWPPPLSCACTVKITDTTEEAATTIFTGTAHLADMPERHDEVRYELHGPSYSNALTSRTWIDGTLLEVFTEYCGASYLNLTLSHPYDRATSPAVYGVFEIGEPIIEMLSTLSEAVNHWFGIKAGTLTLGDMLLSNGSDMARDEFQIFPVTYTESPAYKAFASEAVKKYTVAGTYAYGQVDQNNVAASIEHLYGRVGNNSGNDQLWLMKQQFFIPYQTGKYYMMKVKVRRPNGSQGFWAGFLGYASDRTTIVDRNGGTSYASPCWHCASNPTLTSYTSAWLTKTGYTSGWANPAMFVEAPNVASPGTMFDDGAGTKTEFIRPVLLFNGAAGGAGVMEIDFVAIYEVDSSGNILEELLYDDFTKGFGFDWVNHSGSGERGIYTSVYYSNQAMTTHLGNRKAILEAPRAMISMPLTAANLAEPGQKISWSDESVSPDGAAAVSAWIRVRSISFNVDRNRVIYEGEGARA